jgi:hypothetical protein
MLPNHVRTLWALVVVCLVGATGVQPLRAAEAAHHNAPTWIGEQRPELPVVATARHSGVLVASRASAPLPPLPPLPPFVVAAPPPAPHPTATDAAAATRHGGHVDSVLRSIRSARGPPVR